jgi:hypothetical protein
MTGPAVPVSGMSVSHGDMVGPLGAAETAWLKGAGWLGKGAGAAKTVWLAISNACGATSMPEGAIRQ